MKRKPIVKDVEWHGYDTESVMISCPKDCVCFSLPFCGVYYSILDDELDDIVEQKEFWINENGDRYGELDENGVLNVKVNYKELYKDIAEYTASLLNLKGEYGGCWIPKSFKTFLNKDDVIIYWIVNKEYAKELCQKYRVKNYQQMIERLANDKENTDAFVNSKRRYLNLDQIADTAFKKYAEATNLEDFMVFGEDAL